MYKITIKGEASYYIEDGGFIMPEELHGIDDDQNFVEYISDDETYLHKLDSGYLEFVAEEDKLFSQTIYTASEALNEEELQRLGQYTQGQWSDGIGEGFEQNPMIVKGQEVYISAWQQNQKLKITQVQM